MYMVSGVVLTWNSARYIERCLQSLVADAEKGRLESEIFVVDGGSSDGTWEILSRLAHANPKIKPIQLGKNLGTTASRNIAIRQARGDFLLILDSDAEVRPEALRRLCAALEESPKAGIAAPRLFYPDGSVQISCKRFPVTLGKILKFAPVGSLQRLGERTEAYPPEIYAEDFRRVVRVDHCISACWLVRREALEDVGLLDERIFYSPEDVDYCLRMWLAGWEVLYVPSAEVVHHAQRKSHKSLRIAFVHAQGLIYYFRKHRYWLSRRGIYHRIQAVAEERGIEPPMSATQRRKC